LPLHLFFLYGRLTQKRKGVEKPKISLNVPQAINANFQLKERCKLTGYQKPCENTEYLAEAWFVWWQCKSRLLVEINNS